jgi:MoxR-like ATPase
MDEEGIRIDGSNNRLDPADLEPRDDAVQDVRFVAGLPAVAAVDGHAPAELAGIVEYGASPRGPIALVQSARALALIHGREYVLGADLRALAKDALRHRLVLSYRALAEQRTADDVLDAVLERVPAPPLELGRPMAA